MKNQITSKIVKFTFAFMFVLIASSCSEDNDTMDAAAASPNSEQLFSKGKPVKTTYTSSITGNESDVCVDVSHLFTLSGWNGTASLNVQIYDESTSEYVTIDSFDGQYASSQSLSYTFTEAGVYSLRYQVSGNADNGGTNGFVYFYVTVIDCTICTESGPSTAYAGNNAGGTVTGSDGNNAWWYSLDIGDGSSDITEDVWKGKTTDIGNVLYDASEETITITFIDGWFLSTDPEKVGETVKWHSYADGALPTNGRPTPGLAPNKGTSLTFIVSKDIRYYAIHLDVATCE